MSQSHYLQGFQSNPNKYLSMQETVTLSSPSRRFFRAQLSDVNSLFIQTQQALHGLNVATKTEEQLNICHHLTGSRKNFPPTHTKISNKFSNIRPLGKNSLLYSNNFDDPIRNEVDSFINNKQIHTKEVDVRFSLQRLGKIVKLFLQKRSFIAVDHLYKSICRQFLQRYNFGHREDLEVKINIKRRLYEVLRVLGGFRAIQIDRKMVSLTESGRLKGRALCKPLKKKRQIYEDKKKKFNKLQQQQQKLEIILNSLHQIRKRNMVQIVTQKHSNSKTVKIPVTIITGPPSQKRSIFKIPESNPFQRIEKDAETGNISIQGNNLRIIPNNQILTLLFRK